MDLKYLLFLQELRLTLPHWIEVFFGTISAITIHPLLYLVPFMIYWCLDKKKGQTFMIAVWLGTIMNSLAKLSVCCYRPWIRSPEIIPSPLAIHGATGYSFPSGHSTNATTLFGTLGWLYRKKSRALFAFCCAVIALILFSRNYLGVHTPQDILCGLATGTLAIILSMKFCAWAEENRDKDLQVMLAAVGIATLILIYYILKNYPRDYTESGELLVDPLRMMRSGIRDCGHITALAISWYIERRFINFSTEGISRAERIARFLIGAALMWLGTFALIPRLPIDMNYYARNYARGVITIFPGALLAPLVFKPLGALFKKFEPNAD